MCTTILIRHICGHEYIRKVLKCTEMIHRQLNLVALDTEELNPRAGNNGYVCDLEVLEGFLKPDLCTDCRNMGIVCAFLDKDPSLRYEIVRDWFEWKRGGRLGHADASGDAEGGATGDMECESHMSLSPTTTTNEAPQTPLSKVGMSDVEVMDFEDAASLAGLEVMSPLLQYCFAETDGTDMRAEHEETKYEKEIVKTSLERQGADNLRDLSIQAASLKTKLEVLVAGSREGKCSRIAGSTRM